ncbi:hypothetical protein FK531_20780 [Rhodococcus spelaei]|uniref:Uncharacterized protein n=1 Tax=Rhodococcus spelaei TaxID=2546320 RepID=A0A541AZP2_9NOCA|nr:hypothetical protein [Rhodococcus spelaei]TQF65541.1 hypothetical protein FK531_20780 [Rhodococcus spelaei]
MKSALLRTAIVTAAAAPLLVLAPAIASATAIESTADVIENDVTASVKNVPLGTLCGATLLDQATGTVVDDIAPTSPGDDGWQGYSWGAVADGVYQVRHQCTVDGAVVFEVTYRDLVAPAGIRPLFGSIGAVGEPGLIENLFGS